MRVTAPRSGPGVAAFAVARDVAGDDGDIDGEVPDQEPEHRRREDVDSLRGVDLVEDETERKGDGHDGDAYPRTPSQRTHHSRQRGLPNTELLDGQRCPAGEERLRRSPPRRRLRPRRGSPMRGPRRSRACARRPRFRRPAPRRPSGQTIRPYRAIASKCLRPYSLSVEADKGQAHRSRVMTAFLRSGRSAEIGAALPSGPGLRRTAPSTSPTGSARGRACRKRPSTRAASADRGRPGIRETRTSQAREGCDRRDRGSSGPRRGSWRSRPSSHCS